MHSAGDDLISIPADDAVTAQSIAETLRNTGDWIDAVAGIESVVVRYDNSSTTRVDAEQRLRSSLSSAALRPVSYSEIVEIPIVYGGEGGPDLPLVCEQLKLSADEFIRLHSGTYVVDMLGFIPGFAYIGGLDERLAVSRLAEPRLMLAAGSVGIAGSRTGLYALPGPGGWPIIGRTSVPLFNAEAPQPFTLAPGMRVVFRAANAA